MVSDALCVSFVLLVSHLSWFRPSTLSLGFAGILAAGTIAWVITFASFGLYRTPHLSATEEFSRTISATSVGTMFLITAAFWMHAATSSGLIGLTWLIAVIVELASRRGWRLYQTRARESGRLLLRVLIVGVDGDAMRLANALEDSRLGVRALAFVEAGFAPAAPLPLPSVGPLDQLVVAIRAHAPDCLFVSSAALTPEEMLLVATIARREGVELRVTANLPETLTSRVNVQQLGSNTVLSLRPVRLTGPQRAVKRAFDVAVASLALLLLLPFMCIIAIAIRVTSGGPVLFRQPRVTRAERHFTAYKFRTMVHDPEAHLAPAVDPSKPFFKLEDDPRITRVGRILRRFSIDELPQLMNVVRGDLSLVGPRALAADQVANLGDELLVARRHEMRTGLTGWWQIHGRSTVSVEDALRLDLFYIENWSLALDLFIVLKSFGVVLRGNGAY